MNKFYINGKLIHKASDHNTKRCEVEKWVFLPHSDFERLKANPYQEHEAITAARDLMYEDKNAYHCIMLLDEYGDDGLLIEAEGFDYPRLSMFVPDAKSIYERFQTSEPELKLHDMIKDTVEKITELAHTGKTDFTSADMIDMDEVVSLDHMLKAFKFKVECIQTDNGAEFTKRLGSSEKPTPTLFEKLLKQRGIRHKLIKPYTPRHNGKVERSHRKDNEYFYATHKFYSFDDFKKQLAVHSRKYNNFPMRPLNWKSPSDYIKAFLNYGQVF